MIQIPHPEPKFTGNWWSSTVCGVEHCDAKPATVDLYAGKRCAQHPPSFDAHTAALIAVTFPETAEAYRRTFADDEAVAA